MDFFIIHLPDFLMEFKYNNAVLLITNLSVFFLHLGSGKAEGKHNKIRGKKELSFAHKLQLDCSALIEQQPLA